MRQSLLRGLLLVDAAILLGLGALLILMPTQVEAAFHFGNLPAGVSYIVSMWGCVFATMAIGYFVASRDPSRHVIWVQVGIARGALECLVGALYLARGIVTGQQAGLGIVAAGSITLAYGVLYPRASPRSRS